MLTGRAPRLSRCTLSLEGLRDIKQSLRCIPSRDLESESLQFTCAPRGDSLRKRCDCCVRPVRVNGENSCSAFYRSRLMTAFLAPARNAWPTLHAASMPFPTPDPDIAERGIPLHSQQSYRRTRTGQSPRGHTGKRPPLRSLPITLGNGGHGGLPHRGRQRLVCRGRARRRRTSPRRGPPACRPCTHWNSSGAGVCCARRSDGHVAAADLLVVLLLRPGWPQVTKQVRRLLALTVVLSWY